MAKHWARYFFEPTSAVNLGTCRILFYGGILAFYLRQDFSAWADVSTIFWSPIWLFTRFHLPLLSKESLIVAQALWRTALALSCLGLLTRTSTFLSFVLGVYLLGLPNNFGAEYHHDTIVVISAGILALSRCGDSWSLDRLILIARGRRRMGDAPERSGEYRWPVRLIWVAMSLIFVAAGVAKLRHSGLQWVTPGNMSTMLVQHYYHIANADPITPLGLTIAGYAWLCSVLAAATMMIETAYPLALFSRRARALLVPSAFLMQLGIRMVMGPSFGQYLICNLFWIPWDRVGSRIREWIGSETRYVVAFDGSCGVCRRTVSVIEALDLLGRVKILDIFDDWSTIANRFPQADKQSCLETMHVFRIHGAPAVGFDGYRLLAGVLPLAWPILPLLFVPGVPQVGRRVYAVVAAKRARTCAVLSPPASPHPHIVSRG
jgi:predicted DCC family thiol-disulfide oxidoreductase YuxK